MNLSSLSIRHPVPAILLFVLLTLLGITSFKGLGIQNFPDIEVPAITIMATLEGAAPPQLETEVARKIEDAVASLGEVDHIRTTLTDSTVSIVVEFAIDKNADVALNEVRNAVDAIRTDLPQDLTAPVISKKTTTGGVMIAFTIRSEVLDEGELSWLVDNDIAKAMLTVPGVGRFSRMGGIDREIQVDLDPVRMRSLNITASDVSRLLRQVRKDSPGGRGDIAGEVQSIRTLAAPESLDDLRTLDIPLPGGRTIPLAEIATITDGKAQPSSIALLNGERMVGFELTRSKGFSEVSVAQEACPRPGQLHRIHGIALRGGGPGHSGCLVVFTRWSGDTGFGGRLAAVHHSHLFHHETGPFQPGYADLVGLGPGGRHPGG
ncbi:MAG: cation/multidrug efflux pump [Magnetococcales bacterium]|nr:cation/multidrug efflux pump [Magnetococcales bacterium]